MEKSKPLVDQLESYELSLRRSAITRADESGDPALAELFHSIATRRLRRSRSSTNGVVPRSTSAEAVSSDRDPQAVESGVAGQILAVEPYGPTVRVFRIGRPAGFDFRPGQYLRLGVSGGKGEKFSIASAPHDPHLEVAIELREGGRVTPALFALAVGDTVDLGDEAKGSLRLDPTATHHLMVATVTGIAPLRSMVLDALHRGADTNFTVLLGASLAEELPFHTELEELAAGAERLTYVPTVSRPDDAANRSWTGATGRVDALARTVADSLDPSSTHVYAVGNPGMIASVRRDLGEVGFTVSTESYGS